MSDMPCGGNEVAPVLAPPRRNRYFYGKLLDAPHLQLEQRYGIDTRRLLNRLTLGAGVVCGLDVVPTIDATRVRVLPGVAVDQWGREVTVAAESPPIDIRQPTDACGRPQGDPMAAGEAVIVWLAYHECEAEPVPVLVADCDTERACANSVVREQYAVVVQRDEELPGAPACGFPGLSDGASAHALLAARATAGCAEAPARPWVPLARVVVPAADGRIDDVDTAVRPVVATNQLLLELVLCLADRVEQCCGSTPTEPTEPKPKLVLEKVSGDEQTGEAGAVLADPAVVRVSVEGGEPVAGEPVTFAAAGGDRVAPAADPGDRHDEVVVPTDADGTAAVAWQLDQAPGTHELAARLASGPAVRFTASLRPPSVKLPLLQAMWPPNATVLRERPQFAKQWREQPRLELTFDRQMAEQALGDPDPWLRAWALSFDGEGALCRRVRLEPMGPVEPVLADVRGVAFGYAVDPDAAGEARAFLVQVRADSGTIVDTEGLLLDVDFHGTRIDRDVLARIWDVDHEFVNEAIRSALVDTGAALPAPDGTAGGSYDGWFAMEKPE